MILHTSSLRGLANQSNLGDSSIIGPNRRWLVEEWLEQFEDNDEAELLLEEEHEDEAGALASEAREVADESPPKKWYQRLLKKRGKDDPS